MDTAQTIGRSEAAKYRVTLTAGANTIIADEPENKGGGNTGMMPYELLLSSLAACTIITIRMYAERKGWNPGEIGVDVQLETEKGDTKIIRHVSFSAALETEQRERLLAVANACPVHKLLTGKIAVETGLK